MYQPAFLEIYVAFGAVVLWTIWLRRRDLPPATERLLEWLPWAVGLAVIGGQLLAIASLTLNSAGASADRLLVVARWGSAAAALAGLAVVLAVTVRHRVRS